MNGDPQALGRLAVAVLAVASAAVDVVDAGALIPAARRYVTAGSEAADDGPQVTVALGPVHMGGAGRPQFEWPVPGDGSFGQRNATFTVSVVVPEAVSPQGGTYARQGAPTADNEQHAAIVLMDAAWAIFLALEEAVDSGSLLGDCGRAVIGPLTPRPPQGDLVGVDIAFSAQI